MGILISWLIISNLFLTGSDNPLCNLTNQVVFISASVDLECFPITFSTKTGKLLQSWVAWSLFCGQWLMTFESYFFAQICNISELKDIISTKPQPFLGVIRTPKWRWCTCTVRNSCEGKPEQQMNVWMHGLGWNGWRVLRWIIYCIFYINLCKTLMIPKRFVNNSGIEVVIVLQLTILWQDVMCGTFAMWSIHVWAFQTGTWIYREMSFKMPFLKGFDTRSSCPHSNH